MGSSSANFPGIIVDRIPPIPPVMRLTYRGDAPAPIVINRQTAHKPILPLVFLHAVILLPPYNEDTPKSHPRLI